MSEICTEEKLNTISRKQTVIKYSGLIDAVSGEVRRWITETGTLPDREDIVSRTEDVMFSSELPEDIRVSEIRIVIESAVSRAADKYGILSDLLTDDEINEIMVNGPQNIFAEKNRKVIGIDDAFTSEDELEDVIRMFASDVHREINEANPIVDARLPSGFRVNGVLKSVALNGPILTIRKFSEEEIRMSDLISTGSITPECAEFLSALVKSGYNIFISGGTSSGKTTFLNALAAAIGKDERVIIIEDSAELRIGHLRNNVHMECRSANSIGKGEVTMTQLIRTSLRMRPDRIIVGEVRGAEVVDMIQAMNTGHEGSMSTGHGNSIRGMLNRLETMYMMDSSVPVYSVRSQIANAIDVFVHLRRDSKGRRGVVEVAELAGLEGNNYVLNYLFKTGTDGELNPTGSKMKDRERLIRAGYEEMT